MKMNLIYFISFSAFLPTQAFAESCSIVYNNSVELIVKNQSASAAGGVFFGIVGAMAGSSIDKPNSDDLEKSVKDKIDQIDNSIYLKNSYPAVFIQDEFSKINQPDCYLLLKLLKNELSYMTGVANINMKFQISYFKNGKIVKEESKSIMQSVSSPLPFPPKAKYKRNQNGKWIDVTPPMPTQEEAVESFLISYKKSTTEAFTKLVANIQPK